MNYLYQRHTLKSNITDLNHCIESKKLNIEKTLIDYSDVEKSLEERIELKDMLHDVLQNGDTLIVYDLLELSSDASELIKIFDCLFNRDIDILLCKYDTSINKDTSTLKTVRLLTDLLEKDKEEKALKSGRPKGRFSKSKFDEMQDEIIRLLKENTSVSEIARQLEVSRTSLKDYINSRSLKDIVNSDIKKEFAVIPKSKCEEQI